MRPVIEERRHPRRLAESPQGFLLRHRDREIPARLVDASAGGVGVETLVALPEGVRIGVEGELHCEDFSMEIQGEACVRHCVCRDDGLFRLGLSFEHVVYRNIESGVIAGRIVRLD